MVNNAIGGFLDNPVTKFFDHAKPANRDEGVLAFAFAYRTPRPEIGDKYGNLRELWAFGVFGRRRQLRSGPRESGHSTNELWTFGIAGYAAVISTFVLG